MFLYKLFDVGAAARDEMVNNNGIDYRFCAIMFCSAFEKYLCLQLLPVLKKIDGGYKFHGRGKSLSNYESLTLGKYPDIIKTNSESLSGLSSHTYSSEWWDKYARGIEGFAKLRNDVGHTEPISAEKVDRICHTLFGKPDCNGDESCYLMKEGEALRRASEGAKSFDATTKKLEVGGKKGASQPIAETRQPIQEPPQRERGFSQVRQAEVSTVAYTYGTSQVGQHEGTAPSVVIRDVKKSLNDTFRIDNKLGQGKPVAGLCVLLTGRGFLNREGDSFYPTKKGFEAGIRWARYADGGTGIRFTQDGVEWLKDFLFRLAGA